MVDDLLKTAAGDGTDGTLTTAIGKITAEFDTGQADSLAGKIDAASKTIPNTAAVNFSQAYTNFSNAIKGATDIIDEALKSNDLTELDTTNLKALRSYINETKATFDAALKDSGLNAAADNQQGTITQEKIDKLKSGLSSAKELGDTATEKSTATHKFSQY